MEERSDDCVVCEQQTNEPLHSCFSGIPKLIEYATVLGNDRLATHLREKRDNNTEVKVHPSCQKNIGNIIRKRKKSNPGSKDGYNNKIAKMETRIFLEPFNWKHHCFFCGEECFEDRKHPERRPVFNVTFIHYRDNILAYCNSRNDAWSEKVKRRVLIFDLY